MIMVSIIISDEMCSVFFIGILKMTSLDCIMFIWLALEAGGSISAKGWKVGK